MWKINPCHNANGSTQICGSDFTESLSSAIGAYTAPSRIDLTGSWNIIEGLLDYTNAFQNTILAPSDRIYVLMPPYYLQCFWCCYPRIKIKYIK